MKKGDDVADGEDDDAVRINVSQDQVTATLFFEELFRSTQYIQNSPHIRQVNAGGGGLQTVKTIQFHTFQLDLQMNYRVSNKCRFSYNYFVTGEGNTADFLFPVIHSTRQTSTNNIQQLTNIQQCQLLFAASGRVLLTGPIGAS
jgi:hypothetical protein